MVRLSGQLVRLCREKPVVIKRNESRLIARERRNLVNRTPRNEPKNRNAAATDPYQVRIAAQIKDKHQ